MQPITSLVFVAGLGGGIAAGYGLARWRRLDPARRRADRAPIPQHRRPVTMTHPSGTRPVIYDWAAD